MRGDAREGACLQPAAAEKLPHDALRVDDPFGHERDSIGARAVRIGPDPSSGPAVKMHTFDFLGRRGRKEARKQLVSRCSGISRQGLDNGSALERRWFTCTCAKGCRKKNGRRSAGDVPQLLG